MHRHSKIEIDEMDSFSFLLLLVHLIPLKVGLMDFQCEKSIKWTFPEIKIYRAIPQLHVNDQHYPFLSYSPFRLFIDDKQFASALKILKDRRGTTPFRKVYRNRANQLLSALLALAAERSNVSVHFPKMLLICKYTKFISKSRVFNHLGKDTLFTFQWFLQ